DRGIDLQQSIVLARGERVLQTRDVLDPDRHLDAGALEMRSGEWRVAAAQAFAEEHLGDRRERRVVFLAQQSMTLVGVQQIGHLDAVLLHCSDDLVGLTRWYTYVVRPLNDQHASLGLLGVVDRRALAQELQ